MRIKQAVAVSKRAFLAGLLIGTILASGCVFTPRDAEEPSGETVEWIRPIEPGNVLSNMRSAINALQQTNYGNSLAEDFSFIPSTNDEQEAPPGYFDVFDKNRELNGIDILYTRVNSLQLEWNFNPNEDLVEAGDEATIYLLEENYYQLTVTYTGGEEIVYEGNAVLSLRYEGGQWQLFLWDESGNSKQQSWGRLRVALDIP